MVYNLHTHSMYSVMDGYSSLEDIVSRVKEMGQSVVSLTEHGTMSSCYPMYKECLKQGIKFIPGIELYFCNDVTVKDTNTKHICIYAKNNIGYKNLLTLTTLAHENYYYKPRIDFDLIKQYSDGLIITTACMGGILKVYNETDDIDDLLALKEIFNDDLYIELHTNTLDGQVEFNQKSIEYAKKYNIKLIPASDSHYVKKEDAKIHKRWQIFGEEAYTVEDFYLKSEDDYLDYFKQYMGIDKDSEIWYNMVEAQNELVNKCNVEIVLGGQNYPHCGVDNVLDEIITLCTNKLDELNISDGEYFKRLGNEMQVLEKANYLEYMYMLYDLCKFTDLAGIARGVGRGSVGGSLVAYLLGITKIDPLQFDLVFERFCHLERITPPDIDMDFSQERRGEVIEYLKDKYGHDNVFQVRTFNKMSDKGALKRAGQSLKVAPSVINKISKEILQELKLEDILNIEQAIMPQAEYKSLVEIANEFKGVLQNYGCHASAIIVFPQNHNNWCSVERQGSGKTMSMVASYDFHDLENMGMLKLDILGLATTDLIDSVTYETQTNWDTVDLNDKKTYDMLCSGNTFGVFQIESEGMTDIIQKLQPRTYDDISAIVALYRPGPKDSGMLDEYIKRANGETSVEYLHDKLEPILKNTYGIIVYQEQIQQIVQSLCGYTLAEGDMLRRIIGRKETELMDKAISDMIEAGIKNGVAEHIIKEIADQIKTFALYGFNKAHAYAYGMMSFRTAYLKAHNPTLYVAHLLNSVMGDFERTAEYVEKSDVKIIPPHYLNSEFNHKPLADGVQFGYGAIKGIGKAIIEKPFLPLTDFDKFRDWALYYITTGENKDIFKNKRVIEAFMRSGMFGRYINHYLEEYTLAVECNNMINESGYKMEKYKGMEQKRYITLYNKWLEKNKLYIDKLTNTIISSEDDKISYIDHQKEVLGFSFESKLDHLNLEFAHKSKDRSAIEVLSIRDYTTKKNTPMQFIEANTLDGKKSFVHWDKSAMVVNRVYFITLGKDNKGEWRVIKEYTEVKDQ